MLKIFFQQNCGQDILWTSGHVSAYSRMETGEKLQMMGCSSGGSGGRELGEGILLALTLVTLSTKNLKKLLQSLSEDTGRADSGTPVILFMGSKMTLGFLLLEVIRFAKKVPLATLTVELHSTKSSSK